MNKSRPIRFLNSLRTRVSISVILSSWIFTPPGLTETINNSFLFQQIGKLTTTKEEILLQGASGVRMFYDPIKDIAGSVTGSSYTDADRSWVESGLIVYDIYRQLGGEKLSQPIFFQIKNNLFFVSGSNLKSGWHSTKDEALINFFFSLINRSKVISSLTSKVNSLDKLGSTSLKIERVLSKVIGDQSLSPTLAGGESLKLNFSKSEIVITGPDLNVKHSTTIEKGVTAKVSRNGNVDPGTQSVFGFSSNQKFRPQSHQEVILTDSSQDNVYLTSPGPTPFEEKKLSNNMVDRIITSGEVKRYELKLNNSANVKIFSIGPADVVATIVEKKTGAIINRDDDSGEGYNFSISQILNAGAYIIEVKHCCAGTGAFGLKLHTDTVN